MKLTLVGYYGFRNIGDDLMLQNLLRVLSDRPDVKHLNVFCRENYYPPLPKTSYIPVGWKYKLRRSGAVALSDYVIWGGGTCLYESDDNTGLYWIARLQRLARLFGVRFGFVGIGIGRFRTPRLAALAGKMLAQAASVSFRDESSRAEATALPGYRGSACSGGDLVFLDTTLFEGLRSPRLAGDPVRRISFSGLHGLPDNLAVHYAAQLTGVAQELGVELHFLPAHAGNGGDDEFHRRVIQHLQQHVSCISHTWETPDDYLRIMTGMDFHIGMRLHSIVCADLLGVPSLAIEYAPKVRYYVEKSGILPELRVIGMGDSFTARMITGLADTYRRPDDFILDESEKARRCIDQIFL